MVTDLVQKGVPQGVLQGVERARAARALLATQQLAEGVRLALEALALTRSAWTGPSGIPIDALLEHAERPRLNREVSRAHVIAAERALDWIESLDDRPRRQGQRMGVLVFGGVAGLVALVLTLRPGPAVEAHASAVYSPIPSQGADSVLDGDPRTNWLLPDRSPGWIELRFRSPRDVSSVSITNGRNSPYEDRAAYEVEVLLLGPTGALLASRDQTLTFGGEAQSIDVHASDVARVRVYVRTWHRSGGAIDEIRALP